MIRGKLVCESLWKQFRAECRELARTSQSQVAEGPGDKLYRTDYNCLCIISQLPSFAAIYRQIDRPPHH
ncbi:hypothetical protein J6590_069332 [Homalodisca vitripennis]|nr:hypothetical protein J6590_069332 [Homalodisca vitripennis]